MGHVAIPAPFQHLCMAAYLIDIGAHKIVETYLYLPTGHQPLRSSCNVRTYSHHPTPFFLHCVSRLSMTRSTSLAPSSAQRFRAAPHCCFTVRARANGADHAPDPVLATPSFVRYGQTIVLIRGYFVSTLDHAFYDRRWVPYNR